jgi:hypothetical protein
LVSSGQLRGTPACSFVTLTFSNIYSVYGSGDNLTPLINSSDAAGTRSFGSGGTNDNLVTAGIRALKNSCSAAPPTLSKTNFLCLSRHIFQTDIWAPHAKWQV